MNKSTFRSVILCVASAVALCAYADASTYDDMGAMAGVNNAFWNTTGRTGISVNSSVSATAVAMDTLTWTSAESSPAITMNTKPYVSLKLILR